MGSDYHFQEPDMALFLAAVKECLKPKYTFKFDRVFVLTCLQSAVYQVKNLINGKTT
jgi:hypothetical protein